MYELMILYYGCVFFNYTKEQWGILGAKLSGVKKEQNLVSSRRGTLLTRSLFHLQPFFPVWLRSQTERRIGKASKSCDTAKSMKWDFSFRKILLQDIGQSQAQCWKDPSCAIFSKRRRFEDIKYDTERQDIATYGNFWHFWHLIFNTLKTRGGCCLHPWCR